MPDHLLFLPVSDSLVFSFRCVSVSHFLSVSLSLCLACAYARALLRIQVNSSLPTVDVLAPLIKAIHASLSTSNPGHAASANAAFQVMVCAAITKLRKKKLKHLPEPLHWCRMTLSPSRSLALAISLSLLLSRSLARARALSLSLSLAR